MTMYANDFDDVSKCKILAVNKVELHDKTIKAVVTTSHFNRVTTKPYKFNLLDWAMILERGYIE